MWSQRNKNHIYDLVVVTPNLGIFGKDSISKFDVPLSSGLPQSNQLGTKVCPQIKSYWQG